MAKVERRQLIRDWASGNREVSLDINQVKQDQGKIRLDNLHRAGLSLQGLFSLALLRLGGIPVTRGVVVSQMTNVDQALALFRRERLEEPVQPKPESGVNSPFGPGSEHYWRILI